AAFAPPGVRPVWDAPPTLLVCINRNSQGGPMMRENGVFCVNTLGADAEPLADMFAGRRGAQMEARFQLGTWGALATGAPVLASAVVALDCRVVDIKAVASHYVIFGGVAAVQLGSGGPARGFYDRAYKRGCAAAPRRAHMRAWATNGGGVWVNITDS